MFFSNLLPKKLVGIFLLIIIFLTFFTVNTLGVSDEYLQAVQDPAMNLTRWTREETKNLVGTTTEVLVGAYDQSGNRITSGLIQPLSNLTVFMTITPPISTSSYLAYIKQNIGLGTKAFAAKGAGFTVLEPILPMWIICRNVCYLFFIIIFMVVGLMIIFRTKINPQTVIGIENALPKLVVSLLLVTFSYAIASLFVDIAFLGNYLIRNIFEGNSIAAPLIKPFWTDSGATTWKEMPNVLDMLNDSDVMGKLIQGLSRIPALLIGQWNGIFDLVLAFVLISTVMKLFFTLLTSYITLILMSIISPFAFLWGGLPGQSDTGPKIIKTLISKALVFPVTALFLNISFYFSNPDVTLPWATIPPLHPNVSVTGTSTTFQSLIALGVLMVATSIPAAIDDALSIKPSSFGGGGAQEFTGALRKIPIIGALAG